MGSIDATPPPRPTRRPRRRVARLRVTREGLGTLASCCPFLVVFGLFAWFPILRGFVMSVQETNLVSEPTFVGLENFQRVLADPLLGKAIGNTLWFSVLALVVRLPDPDHPRRAHERGPPRARAVQRAGVPAGRRAAGRGRPVVALLLRRVTRRRVQHDPRLGRAGAAALAAERDDGHALDRHRGDLGRRRRRRSSSTSPRWSGSGPSCTTRPRSMAPRSGRRSGTSRCPSCATCCS